jgi:S1-C subfamily serine protease
MPMSDRWQIPTEFQPDPERLSYDLRSVMDAIVALRARTSEDAFTAEVLGTERAGQGVVIRSDGLVLTIGYLITEADEIWLTMNDGQTVPAHALAYDYESGFGLVQALSPLKAPALVLGESRYLKSGADVVVGGAGGRARSLAARVVARQEFAGYWEYLIQDAIFTAPAHPHWGGTALVGAHGELLGIGSLQLQHETSNGQIVPLNMFVPIDYLKPILDDLLRLGRVDRPARPWLGLYAREDEGDQVVIIGLAGRGPAQKADLHVGDVVHAVGGTKISSLASFYRAIWALGEAGVDVPLTLEREGDRFDVSVASGDRSRFLKVPRLQ